MKKLAMYFFSLLLMIYFSAIAVQAQTFEEYKKQRQQELDKYRTQQQKAIQKLAEQFDEYIKQQDQEYAEYLKQRWQQYELFRSDAPPAEPKPDVQPRFEPVERPVPPQAIPAKAPATIEKPQPEENMIIPRPRKPEPENFPSGRTSLRFYGADTRLSYDESFAALPPYNEISEDAISKKFEQLSQTNYNSLLDELFALKDMMNLNDWGYYLLVKNTSESLAPGNVNMQRTIAWFLMLRSGYKTKIAFSGNEIFVLLPTQNQVFDVNYYEFDGISYYLLEGEAGSIYTYDANYPDATRLLDLNIYKALSLGSETTAKNFRFSFEETDYEIPVAYNRSAIEFYNDYPNADIKIYFDAAISPEAKVSLIESLLPLTQGKSEVEKINLLLRFVQTAFAYQTDDEQFGREKFFFAEEVFHFPYSDCEDRSVLFAWLAQSLAGLEVIGLMYPGHLATAVHFTEDVNGDHIIYEGKKFIIADPTYMNAPAGLIMPDYRNTAATIIPISGRYYRDDSQNDLWDDIIAAGGNRGDNSGDVILADDGSGIVAGYFNQSLNLAGTSIAGKETPSLFVMKLDAAGLPVWHSTSSGDGIAMACKLAGDSDNNIYVSGTFRGEITVGGITISASVETPDIFLAKYNPSGKLLWISKAGLQESFLGDDAAGFNFVAKFEVSGKPLGVEFFFASGETGSYGLIVGDDGIVSVTGSPESTTGLKRRKASLESGGDFSPADAIKSENDRLIAEEYDHSMAGLMAVINLLQNAGASISGAQVQEALDKYNPGFKNSNPDIYQNISRVSFLKNSEGIITIKTDNQKDISIYMMKVADNAKMKVSTLHGGDARVDVLSGMRVGKALWWYNVNNLTLYKNNGNVLFDYDSDNTHTLVNLREDILN
jgi:hypothetical protein